MGNDYLVQSGDKVTIEFTGKVKGEKEITISTADTGPISFVIGENSIFEKIEKALIGMKIDDVKEIELAAGEAYGEVDEELIVEVSTTKLPPDAQVGTVLSNSEDDNEEWLITAIEGDTARLDGNHPLAGETLLFELKLVSIESGNH